MARTTSGTPRKGKDANRDPITKTPGAHPVGTGVGAAAGGAAGTAIGGAVSGAVAGTAAGGPVGTAAGMVVGAVAGGLAGKAMAEKIDPTVEDTYWREQFRSEPYYSSEFTYDDYAPGYRLGYESYGRYSGRSYDEIENELQAEYNRTRGSSRLGWERAKDAVRAAWNRMANGAERLMPGDSDRDGR